MVKTAAIVIPAVKFGYKRYGPKGAVAAALALGASYVVITRVIPRVTDIDIDEIDDIATRVLEDGELGQVLDEEFFERFDPTLTGDSTIDADSSFDADYSVGSDPTA